METLIRTFLKTKYTEPFRITALYMPVETEVCLKSGVHYIAYGFIRTGDLYSYIDWRVPTLTLNEILPYFDENVGTLEKIMLDWMKDCVAEQGWNMVSADIVNHLR